MDEINCVERFDDCLLYTRSEEAGPRNYRPINFDSWLERNYAWWSKEKPEIQEDCDIWSLPPAERIKGSRFKRKTINELNRYVITSWIWDGMTTEDYLDIKDTPLKEWLENMENHSHTVKIESRPFIEFVTTKDVVKKLARESHWFMMAYDYLGCFYTSDVRVKIFALTRIKHKIDGSVPETCGSEGVSVEKQPKRMTFIDWFDPSYNAAEQFELAIVRLIWTEWGYHGQTMINHLLEVLQPPQMDEVKILEEKDAIPPNKPWNEAPRNYRPINFDSWLERNYAWWNKRGPKVQETCDIWSVPPADRIEGTRLKRKTINELNKYVILRWVRDGMTMKDFVNMMNDPVFMERLEKYNDPILLKQSHENKFQDRACIEFVTTKDVVKELISEDRWFIAAYDYTGCYYSTDVTLKKIGTKRFLYKIEGVIVPDTTTTYESIDLNKEPPGITFVDWLDPSYDPAERFNLAIVRLVWLEWGYYGQTMINRLLEIFQAP